MDNNKDPGSSLALWLPGSAVIISLVVSTFALTREPFFEARPTGAQFQVDQPIEARLWQDPFDALERHRKKSKDGIAPKPECDTELFGPATAAQGPITASGQPHFMVALVPGGPYADEVELRRRIRYAILAAFKKDGKVPAEEQHIGCLGLPLPSGEKRFEIPFETFVTSPLENFTTTPLNRPTISNHSDKEPSTIQTILLWMKEEYLTSAEFPNYLEKNSCDQKHNPKTSTKEQPLQNLESLRCFLEAKLKPEPDKKHEKPNTEQNTSNIGPSKLILQVIGPSTSKTLRLMYHEDAKAEAAAEAATEAKAKAAAEKAEATATATATAKAVAVATAKAVAEVEAKAKEEKSKQDQYNYSDLSNIEIYSPLATTPKDILIPSNKTGSQPKSQEEQTYKKGAMKLLRTVSDDNTLTIMLLEELKRRGVDPVHGMNCNEGAPAVVGSLCQTSDWGQRGSRIALVSEWDSLYSRAFAETFNKHIVQHVGKDAFAQDNVGHWLLQFGYLRGLDGLLPEESASGKKTGDGKESDQRDSSPLDIGSLEKADGNSQLDYLRRLAEHIAERDEAYRRNGESGIGAIGVLGTDAYDKLLVLQALKSRMPNKVFFSTDLDARMLQRGQAETVRNLVLAAPYGLTLTQKLQQDVPPFRESSQSAVFVAVLAALATQPFENKRAKFDYSDSGLLSPAIYEVGTHGFIPLKSSHANVC